MNLCLTQGVWGLTAGFVVARRLDDFADLALRDAS
jgi:hypothetical protein